MSHHSSSYDIAIVGCGPVGALLANLLGLQGLSVVVLERNQGILQIPRAVHFDGETMRVFQSARLGVEVLQVVRPGHSMHWVNAQGDTLLIRQGFAGLGDQGWHNDYYFHQPQLEAVLREGMSRFPNVQLREGVVVSGHHETENGITLETADVATGEPTAVQCRYVVGCDGARSIVRTWIGDDHEDLGQHQAWLVVDGVLNHPLPLPEYSVQHCDPARPATSIYVAPLRRRWELLVLPDDDLSTLTQEATLWKLLEPWVKPSQARLERAATYMFHSLVARTWQRGRLLLAGDAAHQTPPFLGQGLCAGVRDAANLAWKLKRAVRDNAHALLATYGPERIPHAREFIQLAVDVGKIIQVTDADEARQRDEKLLADGLSFTFPKPQLGPGAHHGPQPAGQIFIQPLFADGHWMDDVADDAFALLLDPRHQAMLDDDLRSRLAAIDVVPFSAPGKAGEAWLAEHGAAAALIRPDRYVFEVIHDPAKLDDALDRLRDWIRPSPVPSATTHPA